MTTLDDFKAAPAIGKYDMFEEAHDRMVAAEKHVQAYATSARAIALWTDKYCNKELPYDEMISQAVRDAVKDAEFMANVWQDLRRSHWLDEVEITNTGGDLEGVDFVAQRILGMQS